MMETINITIPNMKSAHCRLKVTNAVKATGATIKSIGPAKAEIELANGQSKEAVISAIQKAGYDVIS